MEVTHYQDPVTRQLFREIRANIKPGAQSYQGLKELQKAYKAKGHKTWITFDCDLRSDYCLVIKL